MRGAEFRRCANRRHCLRESLHRRDAFAHKPLHSILRQAFRHGRHDDRLGAGLAGRGAESFQRGVPALGQAQFRLGIIQRQRRHGLPRAHHFGEGRSQALGMAPVEGVIVKGVGDRDEWIDGGADRRSALERKTRERDLRPIRRIRDEARFSART